MIGWKYVSKSYTDQLVHSASVHSNHMINNRTLLFKVFAFEESQKYKEGKYIVERAMITKENQWDEA